MLTNQKAPTILATLKQVQSIYARQGFIIQTLLMDGQFEFLRANTANMGMTLNTVSNNEHVPDIERCIRTVKERVRSAHSCLPFIFCQG